MNNTNESNINNETINKVGLRISDKKINSEINTKARIFEYPHLENVFIRRSGWLEGRRIVDWSRKGKDILIKDYITRNVNTTRIKI